MDDETRLSISTSGNFVDEQERCYAMSALQIRGVLLQDAISEISVIATWPVPYRVIITTSLAQVRSLEELVGPEKRDSSLLGMFVETKTDEIDRKRPTYVSGILPSGAATETSVKIRPPVHPLELVACVIWDHRSNGGRCDFAAHVEVERGGKSRAICDDEPAKKRAKR